MAGDSLHDVIALLRAEMPDVAPEIWDRLLTITGRHFGAQRIYIPVQKKRLHLEALAAADEDADAAQLSSVLGVSVRRVHQLKKLLR